MRYSIVTLFSFLISLALYRVMGDSTNMFRFLVGMLIFLLIFSGLIGSLLDKVDRSESGVMVIDEGSEKDVYRLILNEPAENLAEKDLVIFRVQHPIKDLHTS